MSGTDADAKLKSFASTEAGQVADQVTPEPVVAVITRQPVANIGRIGQNTASLMHRRAAPSMNAEITWDLVMSEDMPFAEGCYRLHGGDWQVVTATKARPDRLAGIRNDVTWSSGVTGMNIVFPECLKINRASLTQKMSEVLGVEEWREIVGPDSMALR